MTERHGTFMAKERANIYTIAKEAGVSPATVSRVLTNNARVSKEKREKVQSVIQKYGIHTKCAWHKVLVTQKQGRLV